MYKRQAIHHAFGHSSTRDIGRKSGISHLTVQKIMREKLLLYPYYLQVLNSISDTSFAKRVTFADFILNDPGIVSNIPLDLLFLGYLRERVYSQTRLETLDSLKQVITAEMNNISQEKLKNAVFHLLDRCVLIQENGGRQIEHLL